MKRLRQEVAHELSEMQRVGEIHCAYNVVQRVLDGEFDDYMRSVPEDSPVNIADLVADLTNSWR